jgi:hypothetical protein
MNRAQEDKNGKDSGRNVSIGTGLPTLGRKKKVNLDSSTDQCIFLVALYYPACHAKIF